VSEREIAAKVFATSAVFTSTGAGAAVAWYPGGGPAGGALELP
jgi:hypothetical protein